MKGRSAGKVKEIALKRSVLKELSSVLCKDIQKPQVGIDASGCILDDENSLLTSVATMEGLTDTFVISTINRALNNLYIQEASPIGITMSLTLRYGASEQEIKKLMRVISEECTKHGIPVLGGETTRSRSACEHILTIQALGTKKLSRNIKTDLTGLQIVMAGNAGMAGTIQIYEKESEKLRTRFSERFLHGINPMKQQLSVREQRKIAGDVICAHDVSEGGIFTALWEMGEYLNCGMRITLPNLLLSQETIELSEFFDINPYLLFSLGCSIYVTADGGGLVDRFTQEGIRAAVIGTLTGDSDRILDNEEEIRYLEPFKGDEMYKL
ncbi:MAG: AIR synthase related protein [Clostridiales bacterium]|nr:AIR synthase related protein [Clostridiales bacterium]